MELNELSARSLVGGVVSTASLRAEGAAAHDIRRFVRRRELVAVRRGWYAMPTADPAVLRAVRAGGVLGCVSALAFHGAWDVQGGRLHVHRSEWARRETQPRLRWCRPVDDRPRPVLAVDDLGDALRTAAQCVGGDDLIAIFDSLRHRRLHSIDEIEAALQGRSERVKRLLALSDWAESGTESLVRVRLRARGIRLVPQVMIPGVGRVDFLVGRRLVIEVDSVDHHTSRTAYHRDRTRDQRLLAMGYIVLRVTWEQVMSGWAEVEQTILSMVRAGLHQRWLVKGT